MIIYIWNKYHNVRIFSTFVAKYLITMDEQIKQIAMRLQGLRDALELTTAQVASHIGIPVEQYEAMESGETDLSVSTLQKISTHFGVSLDELMFGEEPRMNAYFLTRRGTGISIERTKAYKYESLASGFKNRIADPFIVTVEPKPESTPIYYNAHPGQEFNMVLEGRLQLNINGKELILNQGDSLYFDSSLPHGMKALDGNNVRFLAIVMQ